MSKSKNLTIEGDHGKLSAIIDIPTGMDKYPMVIILHGFTLNKNFYPNKLISEQLLKIGIASIRFDFNGHGESEGRFQDMTVLNEIEDTKKVFNYVRNLPEVTSISILGHSQGGVVTSMVAGQLEDKIKCISLISPAAVLRDDLNNGNVCGIPFDNKKILDEIPIFNNLKVGKNYILTGLNLPIYETAEKYKGPTCVVHGDADKIVPYSYSVKYSKIWKNCELHIMPGCDHVFTKHEDELCKIILNFFDKIINGKVK